jgi:hypothetical protein
MDVWCVCMCLFCVCVVLCLGRGPVTSWSLVQGVLSSVKLSWSWKQRPGPKGAVEPVKKNLSLSLSNISGLWWCISYPFLTVSRHVVSSRQDWGQPRSVIPTFTAYR